MSESSAPALETTDQRVSYGIALNIGSNIARQGGVEIDTAAFLAGLQDGLTGAEPRVSEADLQAAFQIAQAKSEGEAEARAAEGSEATIAAGEEFLVSNKVRPGVTTTAGTGPKPTPNQTVKVHYHGTLIDGTVFDSSVQRGEPIEFPVTGVIPGWVEALQLMPVGSKWQLFIPQNLAYGPRATGKIPSGSALIFEVELLDAR
jgi:FKBP-type peptidyl-prolyl cis-trans isomerase